MNRKFPYEIKMATTKTDAILAGLWLCVKVAVCSFVVSWAILALFV